ncbi:unnamed protein product [Schistocephalus solidus]|uniref:Late endosomal/lysosomal adaptor and MAPK and MTOR activator 5 n=1 Tax=Schistocephalus solidus TaxID=70667 RepID=A0A183T1C9_SCHSO|nr:unnamed protein product [Schistocephalus solidus]
MPAPQPEVHPRGPLPRWKAEEGVGQQDAVFSTGSQKKEAVIVTSTETMGTQHFLPVNGVCPDAGVELVIVGSVGADDGGKPVSPRRQVEAHQAIIDSLRQTGKMSHNVVLHGKGKTSIASLCLWPAAPEEGLAGTHLLQLTLLRGSGLAESSNVHLVARQFPSD